MLLAIAFGVGIPGTVGAFSVLAASLRDGSPFRREFWNS